MPKKLSLSLESSLKLVVHLFRLEFLHASDGKSVTACVVC